MRPPIQRPAALLVLLVAIGACHFVAGLDDVDPVHDGSTSSQGGSSDGGAMSNGGAGGAAGSPCGNGMLDAGEACDDGNLTDGDGCSAECAFDAAAQCPPTSQILVHPGMSIALSDTTFGGGDEVSGDCNLSQPTAPEVVYQVVPSESGALRVTLTAPYSKILYSRETCTGNDNSCDQVNDNGDAMIEFPVMAGETHLVFVESMVEEPSMIFLLTLDLSVCGDGIVNHNEECDDGGTVAGDGCSESCVVECEGGIKRPEDHHCYRHFPNPRNWNEALQECNLLGPGWSLAGVSSPEEHNFIDLTVEPTGSTWLGGNDLVTEGTFVWVNGEPFSFDGWGNGEPNGSSGEDCVELIALAGDDYFNDENCAQLQGFICELTPAGR